MPQMSGDQLIERMAQLRPEMQVLCMSGYTDEALMHHGMLDQGISLLQKPFSLDVLARTVRKVLNARRNSLGTSTEQATGIPR